MFVIIFAAFKDWVGVREGGADKEITSPDLFTISMSTSGALLKANSQSKEPFGKLSSRLGFTRSPRGKDRKRIDVIGGGLGKPTPKYTFFFSQYLMSSLDGDI